MRILLFFLLLSGPLAAQINVNNYLFRSKQAIVDNRYPEAIDLLNAVIRVRPEMHDPFFLRAVAKYNLGDFKGAETDLTAALEIKPNFTDALMYRGICRERLLNFNDAIRDFDRALKLDPFHTDVLVSKAFTRTLQEKYNRAIALCDEALSIDKRSERAYLCRAWCRYKIYDLDGAVRDYTKAIGINKFNAETYTKRGMVRAFQLKYNEALEDLNYALSLDSLNLHTLYQLAYVHNEREATDLALGYYSRMIRIDPEIAVAYFERADIYANQGQTDAAIEDYTMVIVLTGSHLLSYFNRGTLYFEKGRYSAAVEDLTKAIDIYPELAEAYYNRAMAYSRMGMHAQASLDVDKAKGIKAELYALDESGQQKALEKMKELARIDEDFAGSEARFGRVQDKRIAIEPAPDFFVLPAAWVPDSLQQSAVYLKALVKLAPAGAQWVAMSHRGWRPSDADDTRSALNEELAKDPENLDVLLRQGVVFQLLENYELALEVYNTILNIDPDQALAMLNRSYVLHKMLFLFDAFEQARVSGQVSGNMSAAVQENYTQIATDLEALTRAHPDFVPARFNLANLNAAIGRHRAAVEQYEAMLTSAPELFPAHFNLGLTLLYLNSPDNACMHLSRAGQGGYIAAYPVIKKYCQP